MQIVLDDTDTYARRATPLSTIVLSVVVGLVVVGLIATAALAVRISSRLGRVESRADSADRELAGARAETARLDAELAAARETSTTTKRELDAARADAADVARELTSAQASAAAEKRRSDQALASLSAQVDAQVQGLGKQLTQQQEKLADVVASAPPDWQDVAERVAASVVLVECSDSTGSGFAIALESSRPGYSTAILTNAHVVAGCEEGSTDQVTYRLGGTSRPALLDAAVYDPADGRDIALLYVAEDIPKLAHGPAARQGASVATMGFPLGLPSNFTTGVVSHVHEDWIQTTAAISAGNSGGPLLDGQGRVLGITTWTISTARDADASPTQSLNFAVPLANACSLFPVACPFD